MFVSIAFPGGNISIDKFDGKQVQNIKHATSFSVLIYLIFPVEHRQC